LPPRPALFPYTTLFRSGFQPRATATTGSKACGAKWGSTSAFRSSAHSDKPASSPRGEPMPIAAFSQNSEIRLGKIFGEHLIDLRSEERRVGQECKQHRS